ncbi:MULTISPECIES: alpha/beta hydrolase [unclassified Frankia]|uniref:alpha/beta hydrolase n=1 Tax=unclassified Frankia TaxID=2632575 RepID=UPI002AD21E0D|nr:MULTISPECIES: alpha/beta hydrolase [unclassified Frankia]
MPYSAHTVFGVLPTSDGEILATTHCGRVGSAADRSFDLGVVVVHGFSGFRDKPPVRAVSDGIRPYAGVLTPDLRGHGQSSGVCTFGDLEVLDVDAAVGEARRLGYLNVITVGWSMGAAAVLRHAAFARGGDCVRGYPVRNPVDAVVSVSAPSRWYVRDTAAMRRLSWLAETAAGRRIARHALGVRLMSEIWPMIPASPLDVAGRIAPTPVLFVHGDRDTYFTLDHPHSLAVASGEHGQLWIIPGFGHAESGLVPGLLDRLGRHLPDLLVGRGERAGVDRLLPGQPGPDRLVPDQPGPDQPGPDVSASPRSDRDDTPEIPEFPWLA